VKHIFTQNLLSDPFAGRWALLYCTSFSFIGIEVLMTVNIGLVSRLRWHVAWWVEAAVLREPSVSPSSGWWIHLGVSFCLSSCIRHSLEESLSDFTFIMLWICSLIQAQITVEAAVLLRPHIQIKQSRVRRFRGKRMQHFFLLDYYSMAKCIVTC
jgi:hypothetical protein